MSFTEEFMHAFMRLYKVFVLARQEEAIAQKCIASQVVAAYDMRLTRILDCLFLGLVSMVAKLLSEIWVSVF
jgi:hypothetical protein